MKLNRETAQNQIGKVREIIGNNRRAAYVVVLVLVGLWWTGRLPPIPSWWPLVVLPAVACGGGAYYYKDQILDLLPDDDGIILVALDETGEYDKGVHRISEDRFERLEIENGELYQWDTAGTRTYEVRHYDPQDNRAVGNWAESLPASELSKRGEIKDVRAEIRELREMIEPEAKRGKELRRKLPGIVRVLDARRDQEVNRGLEESTVDKGLDDATISQVVDENLETGPPDAETSIDTDEQNRQNGHKDESVSVETEEPEALIPDTDELAEKPTRY